MCDCGILWKTPEKTLGLFYQAAYFVWFARILRAGVFKTSGLSVKVVGIKHLVGFREM
jgi:hypothetical protein